jgi:hypothetical protein
MPRKVSNSANNKKNVQLDAILNRLDELLKQLETGTNPSKTGGMLETLVGEIGLLEDGGILASVMPILTNLLPLLL